jgi:hypothetical protein
MNTYVVCFVCSVYVIVVILWWILLGYPGTVQLYDEIQLPEVSCQVLSQTSIEFSFARKLNGGVMTSFIIQESND